MCKYICIYIYYMYIYIYILCMYTLGIYIYIYMPPYEILPLPPLWLVVAHPPTPSPTHGVGGRRDGGRRTGPYIYIYVLYTYLIVCVYIYIVHICTYTCTCICIFICIQYIYTFFFFKHICIYINIYMYTLYIHVCICVYVFIVYIHICIYIEELFTYMNVEICVYIYVYIHMYVCICICICIYVIHTHKYIDTTFSVCCQIFAWNRIRDYSSQETSNVNQRKWRKSTKQVPMINSNLSVQFPGQITRWTAGSWIHPNYACLWGTVHYFHTSWYSSFGTVMAKKTTPFSEAPKNHNISGLHSHCIHRKISI